jgi:hypothetical protein
MNPLLVGPIMDLFSKVADKIWPDPEKKAQAQLELVKLHQAGEFKELEANLALAQGQMDINKAEASSGNAFAAGWRPAVGWICASGLGYQVLLRPLGGWIAFNWFNWTNLPPALEMDTLMSLLFGMLGLGAYRTFEKVKGVAK